MGVLELLGKAGRLPRHRLLHYPRQPRSLDLRISLEHHLYFLSRSEKGHRVVGLG